MKITLSKNQWQNIGKKAGWIKEAQVTQQFPAKINLYGGANAKAMGAFPFALEIEVNVGGSELQIPISQNNQEVQELYRAIASQMGTQQATRQAPVAPRGV